MSNRLSEALEIATNSLQRLEDESSTTLPYLWLRPDEKLNESCSQRARFFHHAGFLHVPSFCPATECTGMKTEMSRLVDEAWNPNQEIDSFGTSETENTARGDYFLESADKVHFFAEAGAMANRKLLVEYETNKIQALNKAGHGLHLQAGSVFHDYCVSDKIRDLVAELQWKDPVVPQSMYIFKQARLGGAVNSHQDSTFLYTTPRQTCLGLWLALDDATLSNGCLWVRPKSHHESVRRRYERNPLHFGREEIEGRRNDAKGDTTQPKFVMQDLYQHEVSWEGDLPRGVDDLSALLEAGFIPVECKAGDLLAFCGELDHLSLPNTSSEARHTFQLHLVEGARQGIEWAKTNWLQYPDDKTFLKLT